MANLKSRPHSPSRAPRRGVTRQISVLWIHTVFFKTRGHLLVWAPPRLASSGLAWPCLAMPCHALSCLAWVWMWRFFVKYKKWDSWGGVVLNAFFTLFTIWLITVDNHMGKNVDSFWHFEQKHRFINDIDGLVPSVSNDPGTFSNYQIDAWKIWRPFCRRHFEIEFIH